MSNVVKPHSQCFVELFVKIINVIKALPNVRGSNPEDCVSELFQN